MAESATALARVLAGGRLTAHGSGTPSYPVLQQPPSSESTWRRLRLDAHTLDRMGPAELLDILPDLSPEAGKACSDFLRLCNPGWEAVAYRPGTEEPDQRAQALMDAFHDRLAGYYGAMDILINRLFLGAYLRGAFFFELVLDPNGREPVDLALPDPLSVRFRTVPDPVRGPISQLGQFQQGRWVVLDRPTIVYLPIDPLPTSSYGRPMASPALFSTIFLLAVMHDLRRVIQQQGYPRIGFKLIMEKLLEMIGPTSATDPDAVKEAVQGFIDEVTAEVATLQPDDSYIHTDVVEMERPVGAVDASSLSGIDPIIELLERQLVRGFKTIPLLFGVTDGVSEANANRQWEMHAATIKAIQHPLESGLATVDTLALQAQGVQADVVWRFSEIRSAEEFRDAQTEALKIENGFRKRMFGLIDQEEFAQEVTGHAAALPEPIMVPSTFGSSEVAAEGLGENPEPGSARSVPWQRYQARAQRAEGFTPKGAGDGIDPSLDEPDEITEADKRAVQALFDETFPDEAGLLDATVVNDESSGERAPSRNGHVKVPAWT